VLLAITSTLPASAAHLQKPAALSDGSPSAYAMVLSGGWARGSSTCHDYAGWGLSEKKG